MSLAVEMDSPTAVIFLWNVLTGEEIRNQVIRE